MDDPALGDDYIFRAMVEDQGMPKLGHSAVTLGVRPGKDIEVDGQGLVHRPSFQAGAHNGLSCSPTVGSLPLFLLPQNLGGRHLKTKVWKIHKANLGPRLVAELDSPGHVSVGPSGTMPYDEYVRAIQATSSHWIQLV